MFVCVCASEQQLSETCYAATTVVWRTVAVSVSCVQVFYTIAHILQGAMASFANDASAEPGWDSLSQDAWKPGFWRDHV